MLTFLTYYHYFLDKKTRETEMESVDKEVQTAEEQVQAFFVSQATIIL